MITMIWDSLKAFNQIPRDRHTVDLSIRQKENFGEGDTVSFNLQEPPELRSK